MFDRKRFTANRILYSFIESIITSSRIHPYCENGITAQHQGEFLDLYHLSTMLKTLIEFATMPSVFDTVGEYPQENDLGLTAIYPIRKTCMFFLQSHKAF